MSVGGIRLVALFYVGNGLLLASRQLSRIPCTVSLALGPPYNGWYLSNSSRPELLRACRVAPILSSLSSHRFGVKSEVKSGTTTPSLFSLSITCVEFFGTLSLASAFRKKAPPRLWDAKSRVPVVVGCREYVFTRSMAKSVNYWTIGTYSLPASNWTKKKTSCLAFQTVGDEALDTKLKVPGTLGGYIPTPTTIRYLYPSTRIVAY